jgi:hypothetical protein
MKKEMISLSLVLAVMLVLGGCSGNLFLDWGLQTPPEFNADVTLSEANVLSYIGDLKAVMEFPDGLSDSEVVTAYDNLKAYGDANDTPEGEAAALTAGALKVQSDENAVELVNNIADAIPDISDGVDDIETILTNIIPEMTFSEFETMVANMQDAAAAFGSSSLGTIENTSYTDAEKGDLAQYATISIVVDIVMADTNISDASYLWDLVNGGSTTLNPSTVDSIQAELDATGSETTKLDEILTWAGYGDLF